LVEAEIDCVDKRKELASCPVKESQKLRVDEKQNNEIPGIQKNQNPENPVAYGFELPDNGE
jgi:hypothetical protein